METLTFITGNYGKYISMQEAFAKAGIKINYFKCDLIEPDINDIKLISKEKARQAFQIIKAPVFVTDSGFYIEDYPHNPGYPGAFVKRSGIASNVEQLLKTMSHTTNRNCYFVDCLTFFDGQDYHQFLGICKGHLSYEVRGQQLKKAKSNLWLVFVPQHCNKTLAEMTDEERINRPDNRTSSTDSFIEWYHQNYIDSKSFLKKRPH